MGVSLGVGVGVSDGVGVGVSDGVGVGVLQGLPFSSVPPWPGTQGVGVGVTLGVSLGVGVGVSDGVGVGVSDGVGVGVGFWAASQLTDTEALDSLSSESMMTVV